MRENSQFLNSRVHIVYQLYSLKEINIPRKFTRLFKNKQAMLKYFAAFRNIAYVS